MEPEPPLQSYTPQQSPEPTDREPEPPKPVRVTDPLPATEPTRRSTRDRRPINRYSPSAQHVFWNDPDAFINEAEADAFAFSTTPTVRLVDEPKTYKQALKSKDRDAWIKAMDKELQSIADKGVWTIVPRPRDRSVVGGRWVFKVKMNIDGTISKYKARYVA